MTASNVASNSHLYSPEINPEIAAGPSPYMRMRPCAYSAVTAAQMPRYRPTVPQLASRHSHGP